ncbi:MAG: TVP38/TMEM64 family protein, partial [Nitrospiraceae bacterium]
AHYATAVAAFIVVYCLTAALSVPGDIFLTMIGGFLFGSVIGTFYVNIGATAGATLAFLAARYLLRDWVESKFADRIGPIQEGFKRNAFSYLVTLRLIPAIPFVLVNLVSGLTRMDLGTYVRATSLGMFPASFVFAYAGRQLGMINSVREVASPPVLLAFTLLGLLALTPPVYRTLVRTITQRRRRHRVAQPRRHTDDL